MLLAARAHKTETIRASNYYVSRPSHIHTSVTAVGLTPALSLALAERHSVSRNKHIRRDARAPFEAGHAQFVCMAMLHLSPLFQPSPSTLATLVNAALPLLLIPSADATPAPVLC